MSELFSSRKKTPNKIYHCVCFVRNHKLLGSVHIVWLINDISESQRWDGHCSEKLSLLHGFKIFFCTAIGILDSPNYKKKHTQKNQHRCHQMNVEDIFIMTSYITTNLPYAYAK